MRKLWITSTLNQLIQNYKNASFEEIESLILERSKFYSEEIELAKYQGYSKEEILNGFYVQMDLIAKDIKNVSCKKGCNFCCHINVDISETEAQLILIEEVLSSDQVGIFKEQKDYTMQEHSEKYSPCGFLSELGECSIYSVRPLSCRKYFVVNEPNLCDVRFNGIHGQVQIKADLELEVIVCVLASELIGINSKSMAKTFLTLIKKDL